MSRHSFLTTWLVEAPREHVWEVLADAPGWPAWWRGVVRVEELAAGDSDRVGSRYLVEWRSRVLYPVAFEFTVDRVDAPRLMEGGAEGDLAGRGRWHLLEDGGVTAVLYEWKVVTSKRWMNVVSPLARPLFEHNHDVVMRWGGEGLARRLGVRLLAG